ncbi:MAG: DUF5615 family PIN-like protein [Coriobacteriales bacterium]|jgi:predicted nuclease of predicted toxin-antitoxin system|nr:DUF5615 family PIN-like protein [Coriobacteriales bacterium]
MNLAPRWVSFLADNGYCALHWSDIGVADAPDREIVEYARASNCAILTNDLDFGAILSITGGTKPSIIQIRANDVRPEEIGEQVLNALRQAEMEIANGALVTILPARMKIKILPLFKRIPIPLTEADNQIDG